MANELAPKPPPLPPAPQLYSSLCHSPPPGPAAMPFTPKQPVPEDEEDNPTGIGAGNLQHIQTEMNDDVDKSLGDDSFTVPVQETSPMTTYLPDWHSPYEGENAFNPNFQHQMQLDLEQPNKLLEGLSMSIREGEETREKNLQPGASADEEEVGHDGQVDEQYDDGLYKGTGFV